MSIDRPITLLYVDDEEANLLVFQINFESKYTLYTASSAWEALEVLKLYPDDIIVVITDMRMPRMSGLELIKEAKKRYRNIIYFILSGYESDEKIEKALQANIVDRFFTKPLNMEKIEGAIFELLESKSS